MNRKTYPVDGICRTFVWVVAQCPDVPRELLCARLRNGKSTLEELRAPKVVGSTGRKPVQFVPPFDPIRAWRGRVNRGQLRSRV